MNALRNVVRYLMLMIPMLAFAAAPVHAQSNIRVLGTGQLAWDQGCQVGAPSCTPTDVQAFTYKGYMPATSTTAINLVVTCTAPTAPATVPTCKTALTSFPLTSSAQSLAVSAGAVAADGTQVEQKTTAPFTLSKGVLAAAPAFGASPVTP